WSGLHGTAEKTEPFPYVVDSTPQGARCAFKLVARDSLGGAMRPRTLLVPLAVLTFAGLGIRSFLGFERGGSPRVEGVASLAATGGPSALMAEPPGAEASPRVEVASSSAPLLAEVDARVSDAEFGGEARLLLEVLSREHLVPLPNVHATLEARER